MKYIKSFLIITFIIFALVGCQSQEQFVEYEKETTSKDQVEHIGCQEGEIDEEGNCVPTNEGNVMLFGQDLDPYVDVAMVDDEVVGFLAKPKEPGIYPGVVMIHEWWGLNDNIKEMAKILAKEGYTVFAIDLYDGEVADNSDKAGELATNVRKNPASAIAKMKKAVSYLNKEEGVTKIASLGWCFGGQQSLNLSLNENLDATVIYYGQLIDDKEKLKSISGPVLGIFGAEDTSISVESVNNFETALNDLGVQNSIYVYPGVGHAFANPSGSNYAKNETLDAWAKTVNFLNENLKGRVGTEEVSDMKVFSITGENYKFLMDGEEAPELKVKKGDKVRIEFTSTEGFHDWVVDEFDANTEQVRAGDSTFVEFVADKVGTFEYYCSVGNHRAQGMVGKLVVE